MEGSGWMAVRMVGWQGLGVGVWQLSGIWGSEKLGAPATSTMATTHLSMSVPASPSRRTSNTGRASVLLFITCSS